MPRRLLPTKRSVSKDPRFPQLPQAPPKKIPTTCIQLPPKGAQYTQHPQNPTPTPEPPSQPFAPQKRKTTHKNTSEYTGIPPPNHHAINSLESRKVAKHPPSPPYHFLPKTAPKRPFPSRQKS